MKQVSVESNKAYYHGFVLREPDLRRLIDVVGEQLHKLGSGDIDFVYTVKYQNGTVAETADLDAVFAQENAGSASIVRLVVQAKYSLQDSNSSIEIVFRNVDSRQESGEVAIKFTIKSDSRDWVFVTSSILDERIAKTKRLSFNQISERRSTRALPQILLPMVFLISMFIGMFKSDNESNNYSREIISEVNQIESSWLKGAIKSDGELILKLAKTKAKSDLKKDALLHDFSSIGKMFGWIVGGFIILFLLAMAFEKLYPGYNFCWGEYLETFNKKESARKFILVVVLLGLVLSIAGGLITNYIGNVGAKS